MEGFKQNTKEQSIIEKSANYEGDHTLLLYERLKNPKILEKLINTTLEYIKSEELYFLDETTMKLVVVKKIKK